MVEIGFLVLVLFCFGAAIGSFLHVIAERYMSGNSALKGRSYCPYCKKTLTAFEMVPIVSYIVSGARCRGCHIEIPAHYPTIEFLTGMLSVLLLTPSILQGNAILFPILLFISACILVVLIRIDSKLMLLPDGYIYALTIIALLYSMLIGREVSDMVFGVLAGAGALYLLWIGTSGRGLGFGDVKLMVPLGILFGLPGVITLLFFAFFSGGSLSLFLLATKQVRAKTAIPFGPFLAGAALLLMAFPGATDRFFIFLGVY